jgi:MinD-like ATPase involved in chromosome partitioning or flagellar assembly
VDDQVPETVRPLTRRELRARSAALAQPEEPSVNPDAGPEAEVAGGREAEGSTGWRDDVRWSLQRELPATLPAEPDEDDVRWELPFDAVVQEDTVGLVRDPASAAPVRRPAWPAIEDVAGAPPSPSPSPSAAVPGEPGARRDVPEPREAPEHVTASPGAPVRRSVTGRSTSTAAPNRSHDAREATEPGDDAPAWAAAPAEAPGGLDPAAPPAPVPVATIPGPFGPPAPLPTLSDLLAARPQPPAGPAEHGWRGTLRRVTGGLVKLPPGPAEQAHRSSVARVQRSLEGPRTVVVMNPKGGAHKTTATLLLAASFGQHRGGYTLAWDNNETRGTLGWRSQQALHHNTAVNLLQDLERFADRGAARIGDLDNYVRSQGSAQFDVLASDEDAASAASIDAFAFRSLHRTLSRFYRVMVVDTGNNMRASNWQAAVEAADQVVVVSTVREDTAQSAAWAIDALRATGHEDVVRRAVTVLSAPAPQRDEALAARLHDHFGQLTRAVLDVPYDPSLVGGTPLDLARLQRRTREAWLHVAAAVADGL